MKTMTEPELHAGEHSLYGTHLIMFALRGRNTLFY
jgi:hypothetical protein